MTIIAAKQFKEKRTLFTDDCITVGQAQISASKKYRPKLREIIWKSCRLIIASCWWTREVDMIINLLEAKLDIKKVKDTIWLTYLIQTVLIEAFKTLWEVWKDPSVWLLILEPETNTLRHSDDYSVFQVNEPVEIVAGSGEQAFFSLNKYESFLWALLWAVKTDEYCDFPIYAYRDWKMHTFWPFNTASEMSNILNGNTINYDATPEVHCKESIEPSWLTEALVAKLW